MLIELLYETELTNASGICSDCKEGCGVIERKFSNGTVEHTSNCCDEALMDESLFFF